MQSMKFDYHSNFWTKCGTRQMRLRLLYASALKTSNFKNWPLWPLTFGLITPKIIRLSSCSDLIKFEVQISSNFARMMPISVIPLIDLCDPGPLTYLLQNLIRSSSYGATYYPNVRSSYLKLFLRYRDNGQTGRTYGRTTRKHDASGPTFGGGGIKTIPQSLFFYRVKTSVARMPMFCFFLHGASASLHCRRFEKIEMTKLRSKCIFLF